MDEEGHVHELLRRGFGSAHAIAARPRRAFVRGHADALGGAEAAERVHRRASGVRARAAHMWATINSTSGSPHTRALRANVGDALPDAFADLPSYQELFGSLDYYEVADCDSILGPAAYLVDLLRLIDEYVTTPNASIPTGLSFAERRPDIIGELELTCEQTTGRVPYLGLVNARLTSLAAAALKGPAGAAPLEVVATATYPLSLPLNVPLLKIRTLLDSIGIELADVFAAWNVAAATIAPERLGLAPAQANVIVTSQASDAAKLAALYGLTAAELPTLSAVETFTTQAGIDAATLTDLIAQNLSAAELAGDPTGVIPGSFFISQGPALGVSSDGSTLTNATDAVLDRANRFLRVAARLGWTFEQTDWAVRATGTVSASTLSIDVAGLAELSGLMERLDLDVLTACSLVADLKTYGAADGPTQFDLIFNAPAVLGANALYHPAYAANPLYTDSVEQWSVGADDTATQALEAWLAGALGVDGASLRTLVSALPSITSPVALDVPTLSALRRHTLLAGALRLTIDRYLAVVDLADCEDLEELTCADVLAIADVATWIEDSSFSAETVDYVVNDTLSPAVDPLLDPAQIAPWLTSLQALIGALDEVPAAAPGLAPLVSPALAALLTAQVAALLSTTPDVADNVMQLAAGTQGAGWPDQLLAADPKRPSQAVIDLLRRAARWLVVVNKLGLPAALLESINTYPEAYGLNAADTRLGLDELRSLAAFQELTAAFRDADGGLVAFAEAVAAKKGPKKRARLVCAVTGWDVEQAKTLLKLGWAPSDAVGQLVALTRCFDLSRRLDADVDFLGSPSGLASLAGLAENAGWATYVALADGVRTEVAGLYDPTAWTTNAAALDGAVAVSRRDALVPVAIWALSQQFGDITSADDLHDYLLTDVSMGPVAETTPVVEATCAAQLYLQRCQLGVELGVTDLSEIEPEWWDWMLDYGTWRANREVFLYPENYLLPSVRRTKTDLFEAFESQLQQSQLSDQYVGDAYRTYFESFRTLGKLTIVDSCVSVAGGTSASDPPRETLHVVARTSSDPVTYYVRTRTRTRPTGTSQVPIPGVWSPWSKVDVAINAETVTPVFAFGSLSLFWAELSKSSSSQLVDDGKGSGPISVTNDVWKASLRYTSLTHEGTWTPAQTLVADQVVDYRQQGASGSTPEVEDMAAPPWRKPYVVHVSGPGFAASATSAPAERIVVFYGPAWSVEMPALPMAGTSSDPDEAAFEALQYDLGLRRYLATTSAAPVAEPRAVALPVADAIVLNADFAPGFLLERSEFAALNLVDSSLAIPFAAAVDPLNGSLALVPSSGGIVLDNYLGDVATGYGRASVTQLGAVAPGARAISVKNQPGWIVANNGDEAFLLAAPSMAPDPFVPIDAVLAPFRKLTPDAFAAGSITRPESQTAYADLQTAGLIDANGHVVFAKVDWNAVSTTVFDDPTAQIWAECMLLGHPVVTPEYLAAAGLSSGDVRQVVDVFLDPMMMRLIRWTEPGTVLAQARDSFDPSAPLDTIASELISLPTQATLGYVNTATTAVGALADYEFEAQRLTLAGVDRLSAALASGGVERLLSFDTQLPPTQPVLPFSRLEPAASVTLLDLADGGQVDFAGASAPYTWEIFFHLPILVATSLAADQQFEAADRWFRFVFDPTVPVTAQDSTTDRYWRFLPFRGLTIDTLRDSLSDSNPAIHVYEDDPFDPHAIAALRPGTYEKSTVMQYVDSLIQWGDALFARYTADSVTAATQLYLYAGDLLGPAPVGTPFPARDPATFETIETAYAPPGSIPRFLIDLEMQVVVPPDGSAGTDVAGGVFNDIGSYFGVPPNSQLTAYWDTIADRLGKIRDSRDINGAAAQVTLFPPRRNPLDLVKAGAAGGTFLPPADAPLVPPPAYRFTSIVEHAQAVTAQVTELGEKLLAALEKGDAESLELLRTTQEGQLLDLMTTIKRNEIEQLQDTLAAQRVSEAAAKARSEFYAALIVADLNSEEQANLDASIAAVVLQGVSQLFALGSSLAFLIPQIGSPFAMTYGGEQAGAALSGASTATAVGADISAFMAQRALTMAGYARREEDWGRAKDDATAEAAALKRQAAATEVQIASARQDLAVHLRSIEQNARVADFLTSKFTNAALYQWMVSRLSTVYFGAFQLALGLVAQAQAAYRFELGVDDNFLSFAYWDTLHKGLTAGDSLAFSLAQMQTSYLRKSTRRLEIERTVSLALWSPQALLDLKETGECKVVLSEELFDYDYPGHYNRQIRSVSVSIPAVLGPYETFKATLTQDSSVVLTAPDATAVATLLDPPSPPPPPSPNLVYPAGGQQIAISRGVADSGLFELDPRDERYLPFEGTGAVSTWTLSLPQATNRFDFDAITDVIITVDYTALDGDKDFTDAVIKLLGANPLPAGLYASVARAQPLQWAAWFAAQPPPLPAPQTQTLTFAVNVPNAPTLSSFTLKSLAFTAGLANGSIPDTGAGSPFLTLGTGTTSAPLTFKDGIASVATLPAGDFPGTWTLTADLSVIRADMTLAALLLTNGCLDPAKLVDLELVAGYTAVVSFKGSV